jgi:hypothetical protein
MTAFASDAPARGKNRREKLEGEMAQGRSADEMEENIAGAVLNMVTTLYRNLLLKRHPPHTHAKDHDGF